MRIFAWSLVPCLAFVLCSSASAQPVKKQYTRLYEVSYNPILKTRNDVRLHSYWGWWNPYTEAIKYMAGMKEASHGIVNERLVGYLEMDFFPVKADGFQYSEAQYLATNWHSPDGVDYKQIIRNYDLARKVDFGEVDEAAIMGAPYFGYWESTMCGFNGYYCNSGPQTRIASSRIFVMMGWNYERVVSLHATGHRAESIMTHVYDGWHVDGDRTIWDRFGWNVGQTTISNIYGVGSAHLPANGADHYDYANPQTVTCYAPDWLNNFPNFTGETGQVNRDTWGLGPTNNYEFEYFKWWYQHMPHVAGRNNHDNYDRLNNWWEYIFNFNEHPESNGDHVPGGTPSTSVALGDDVVAVSVNDADDFMPKINNSGRVVWRQVGQGFNGTRGKICSANADGSDSVVFALRGLCDNVEINNAGQIVWQQFDRANYQIHTASAYDNTTTTQITDVYGNAWHPDINDSGRIVWDQWDGTDYEIFSANVDGSDLVQITNRAYSGTGQRPNDMWPRINNAGRVVWFGYANANLQIFSANADGSDLTQITSASYYQNEFPQISDSGKIVWHAWYYDNNAEVYSANADGTNVQRLSTNYVQDWWPQVNAQGDVVWMQRTNSDGWEIMLNGTPITDNTTHDQYPTIDDNGRIIWQGFDGADWEIYTYEDGTIYQVTDNDYDDFAPASGNLGGKLVWHAESAIGDPTAYDYPGPTMEIFATSAAGLVGDLNCDGTLDVFDIDPFVQALVDPSGYSAQYPDCDVNLADVNGDEVVDVFDIDPFVAVLVGA